MKSFIWNKNFILGIDSVDKQHKKLVDLINQFSKLLAEDIISFNDINIDIVLDELSNYAFFHFHDEERVMEEIGLDPRHIEEHRKTHDDFIHEISFIASNITKEQATQGESLKYLLDFLIHWLIYHILGIDKDMTAQINDIKSGISPKDAYDKSKKEPNTSTELLLTALNELFDQVSTKNRELMLLTQSLEEKVKERTEELEKVNKNLKTLSLTDTLTQLPNRRHAMQTLNSLWEYSIRENKNIAVMMVDADHFKEVNDTFGHDAGDIVLKQLSNTLKDSIRTDDTIARLGGDEFFVICPNTDIYGGIKLASTIHKKVTNLKVKVGENGYWIGSVSIGVASKIENMKNFEDLIKLADKGVYLAKKDGKNCVRTIMDIQ